MVGWMDGHCWIVDLSPVKLVWNNNYHIQECVFFCFVGGVLRRLCFSISLCVCVVVFFRPVHMELGRLPTGPSLANL